MTPWNCTVRHLDLIEARRANIKWTHCDGGHMMYTILTSLAKPSAEVSAFVKQP